MVRTRPYEFMVKYTQQEEWIEGKGVFIAFALFLGGISGGLYLAAAYFDNLLGMFVAWLLSLLMSVCYVIHLGKPLRFWRAFSKPRTSWIARGFIFIMLFIGFAFIQLILSYWFPETVWVTVLEVLAGIFAFAQSIYTGFVLSSIRAIKMWNSAIVPILFVTCGLSGGLAILLAISLGGSHAQIIAIENVIPVMLIFFAIILTIYLWNTTYTGIAGRDSVLRLVRGGIAAIFWIGVVFFGIIIPLAISVATYLAEAASSALLITAVTSELIGSLALRYAILKAGIYSPLAGHRPL